MLFVLLENLTSLLVCGLLVAGAGAWIERRVFTPELEGDRGLRVVARLVLGFAVWIGAAFVAAVAGALRRESLWLLVAAVVVGTAIDQWRAWRALPPGERPWRRLGDEHRAALVDVAGIGLLLVVLLPVFLFAMTPTVSWDAGVYHLTLPRLFIDNGGFRPVELSVYSTWPLAIEMLYAWAMLARGFVLAKLMHFGFGILTLYAVYLGGRSRGSGSGGAGAWGWTAIAFTVANGVVLFELRVAYVDLAYAFFLVAAFLFVDRALDAAPEARSRWLALGGLAGGLVASVKITGFLGVAVVAALYLPRLWTSWRAGAARRETVRFAVAFGLPALALWLPWTLRTAWLTGNPVYPFLHRWLGGPDWSAELGRRLAAWQQAIGMGREPIDYLLLPVRVVLEGGPGYARFDGWLGWHWLAVAPVALLFAWRRARARRALAAAGLYFAIWAFSSQQARFLIPCLPLLAIAGAGAFADLAARIRWGWVRRGLFALALVAPLVLVVAREPQVFSLGYRLLESYPESGGDWRAARVPPVFALVDERLPDDARLLFLGYNQGFFCRREYLADSFFEASQIADWLAPASSLDDLRQRLAERGITHLLVDRAIAPRVDYPELVSELLGDPSRAELLFRAELRYEVYRLRPSE